MIPASARAAVALRSCRFPAKAALQAASVGLNLFAYPRTAGSSIVLPPGPTIRLMHNTAPSQSAVYLIAGLSVAGVAVAARYGLQLYEKAAAAQNSSSTETPAGADGGSSTQADGQQGEKTSDQTSSNASGETSSEKAETKAEAPKQSASFLGGMFGGQAMAKRFYKGGFEDKMTRREAALILGVRESATPERIRERHRKLLMVNHPDAGGSTFIASKVNEAKDFLIKGRS